MSGGSQMGQVPPGRIRLLADRPVEEAGAHVLYWMTSSRRTRWSFPLQRAVDWAKRLRRPLVVLEALRCGYPWAADRHHRFILDGMRDNAARLDRKGVSYLPYVEPRKGAGKGLLAELASRSSVVVADDSPAFFYPQMLESAAEQVPVRFEAVDGNGILPLSAADRVFTTAFSFRRFLQKTLPDHLGKAPAADPLRGLELPGAGRLRLPRGDWSPAARELLEGDGDALEALPIDHAVKPVVRRGGERRAARLLKEFLAEKIRSYSEERNLPQKASTSSLSPYLHYGHVSSHQVVHELLRQEGWSLANLGDVTGSRVGWWGVSPSAEEYLDQVITWRELGFNMCALNPRYDQYDSLPGWAQKTLRDHEKDRRPHLYSPEELEEARTHDDLWNAAQNQLVREGTIHNYLRMLWGKKILEWSPTPRSALEVMIHLNNKYALDGRDPNSTSGIFWCLGRYDRPWGPERRIFGKVRYMSSDSTRRKMPVKEYIERYGAQPALEMSR